MEPINILFIIVFLIVIYLIYRDGMEKFDVTVTDGTIKLSDGWSIVSNADKISFKKDTTEKFAFGKVYPTGKTTGTKLDAISMNDWKIYDNTWGSHVGLVFTTPGYNSSSANGKAAYINSSGYILGGNDDSLWNS